MVVSAILSALALLSLALTLWQWVVARRFPLHERVAPDTKPAAGESPQPTITLLKPLKGCDAFTEDCLRSWFTQQYAGPVQILFGVASRDDPVLPVVHKLQHEFPDRDAQLVVCGPLLGANAKVSQLTLLEPLVKHDLLVISDADVRVPPDLLTNLVAFVAPLPSPFVASHAARITHQPGLACCFYRLANPSTLAMRWEATAVNADFWSQVLQSQSLKPIDFAMGAVMALPRLRLEEIGGFKAFVDYLADDYQLSNRIARLGYAIVLCPVVVDCWSAPMDWAEVWKHQLRWARTIRVCKPLPYFFSILSNATLWPLIWVAARPTPPVLGAAVVYWLIRILMALDLQSRIECSDPVHWLYAWLVPLKDLLQAAIWLLAFLGNRIEWRGQKMRLRPDGTLQRLEGRT